MSLDKDPLVIHRREVLADEARRREAREKLRGDADDARRVLNPRYQLNKAVARNKARAKGVVDGATAKAKVAAPFAAVIGVGAAIFFARKPIAKWISQLRTSKTNTPDGE